MNRSLSNLRHADLGNVLWVGSHNVLQHAFFSKYSEFQQQLQNRFRGTLNTALGTMHIIYIPYEVWITSVVLKVYWDLITGFTFIVDVCCGNIVHSYWFTGPQYTSANTFGFLLFFFCQAIVDSEDRRYIPTQENRSEVLILAEIVWFSFRFLISHPPILLCFT